MKKYEEYQEWSTGKSWLLVIGISAFLLIMAMGLMFLIEDVPREWDFGNVEFTPGKSVYSTATPEGTTEEKMIAPLPEGISMQEKKELMHKNEN